MKAIINNSTCMIVSRERLTRGTVGKTMEAEFSADWEGLAITATFEAGDEKRDKIFTGEPIVIPHEVLTTAGVSVMLGFQGAMPNGTIVKRTEKEWLNNVSETLDPAGVPSSEPTPDWTAQVQNIATEAKQVADSVRSDADAGKFNGQPGEAGGWYAPDITQPDENTMRFSFTPSKEGMPAVADADITLPAGGGGGGSGEDGGYYTPAVTQTAENTMQVAFTPSKTTMPAVPGTEITLPEGPAGKPGAGGKSAYAYAVEGGYAGTEAEFSAKMAAEIPTVDSTLTKARQAADAAKVGNRLSALSEEKVSLPKDADGNTILGTVGWYAVSDGAGGITWVESAPSGGGETTTHGIVWNLVNVTSSNNAVSVADGASLVAVLTPADGYTLGDVTITMGGEVVTGAWNADTATVTIQSVTGDVVISCAGVEQTGPVDTSPVIVEYNKALDSSGGVSNLVITGGCYTDFYTIPEGATDVTLYMADSESVSFSAAGKLQFWNDTKQIDYWSAASTRNQEKSYVTADGATRFRTSLATNGIEDSYAYDSATGYIYFAGKNTQYYGKTNINGSTGGESAVSVAAKVDNQVAMLALSTGETVNPSAYSGLSADYVSMVQANYDAMMAECLGDYNKIPIIVHTDQHGRIGASNQVMKLIGDMVNWYEVSKCMNLGDTVPDRFDMTTLDNYLSATKDSIPLSKRLDVYGNHDVWDSNDSQKYTVDQKRLSPYFKNIYARRHGNNGYFTVFDDYYNVKYLVISDLEYPDTNYSTRRITTAQAKFIVSELSEDDGRDVVLVSHVPLDSDEVTSRDSTYQAYSEKFLSDTTAHNSFMTMIAARKNKTSGTFTDSEGAEHAYDFSGVSGNLLMSLHGHTHWEAYRTFENSITEFAFDWFDGNTFYFAYIDRAEKKFKVWKNEANVEALEISIA